MAFSIRGRDLYTPLPSSNVTQDKMDLVGTCIGCIFYGFLALLYHQCVKLLILDPKRSKYTWVSLAYSTAIFAAATVGIGSYIHSLQRILIDLRGAFQEDPVYPFLPRFPTSVSALTSYMVVIWLQDGLLLYRFLYIWNWNYYLLVIPSLIYLATIALSIVNLIWLSLRPSNVPWISMSTAFWSLSLALNLILTLAIAGRLLYLRSRIRDVIGPQHSTIYISMSSILIESAALYSVAAILFLVVCNINTNLNMVFLPSVEMASAFAPMLIQYRLASQRDASKQSVQTLSQLAFAPVTGGVRVSVVLEQSTTDLPGSPLPDFTRWETKNADQRSERSAMTV